MQRSMSESNIMQRRQTRSCKKGTTLPESKKRHKSLEQSANVKQPKKQKLQSKEDLKQANMCQQQKGISTQSTDVARQESISTIQNTCSTKVIPPLDDHDLTPYPMELSDDEMAGVQVVEGVSETAKTECEATKRKSKTRQRRNRKSYDFSTMIRKDIESELEKSKLLNKELLRQLNEEQQKTKDLEDCIDNMKDEKSSIKNDINIYGGHCAMQVGDSSLLEMGGQEKIKHYIGKRMDAQDARLNKIEMRRMASELSHSILM